MTEGNKEWWTYARWSDEFEQGTDSYIQNAFLKTAQGNQIVYPCQVCSYRYWYDMKVVKDHIICSGFVPRSERTIEGSINETKESGAPQHDDATNWNDGVEELMNDTFIGTATEDAMQFVKLFEEGQEELFSGCTAFTRLSFIVLAYVFKCDFNLSNAAFVGMFKLFKEVIPNAKVPLTYNEAKKVLKLLGLDYTKIDACSNDCMLYWEEHANVTRCYVCGTPRWKSNDKDVEETNKKPHRIPLEILRYFPIKKRLQRLYMCPETARYMTSHANEREKDGLLQHPADGRAWKDFDNFYPSFPKEIRM